jgi:hypothetical protein
VLAGIPGLQRPLSQPDVSQHYFKSYKVYHERVLAVKDGQWKTGRTPQQVAAILKEKGLKHADEDARYASVVVLANLGQREAILMALADPSSRVRLTAAKALAETRWSDGWATCYGNPDAEVRKAVEPLLGTAGNQPLSRTPSITELLQGLESSSIDTRTFCQAAMQRISGKKEMSASAWWAWWRKLGNARPGLIRIEPDESAVADETIDFGAWWQSGQRSIQNRPNPLLEYSRSTKIHWRGYLVVTRSGDYQFYVRSRAEWRKAFDKHGVLYFTSPCTKLYINGGLVLPESSNVVEDAKTHTRIDYSKLINLKPGLHTILLELDVKSAGTGYAQSPCIRFYWGSEHFPRELVPAEHLIHFASE